MVRKAEISDTFSSFAPLTSYVGHSKANLPDHIRSRNNSDRKHWKGSVTAQTLIKSKADLQSFCQEAKFRGLYWTGPNPSKKTLTIKHTFHLVSRWWPGLQGVNINCDNYGILKHYITLDLLMGTCPHSCYTVASWDTISLMLTCKQHRKRICQSCNLNLLPELKSINMQKAGG